MWFSDPPNFECTMNIKYCIHVSKIIVLWFMCIPYMVLIQDSFKISNGIDGSALSYTISYTDSTTGVVCVSVTISATTCVQRVCTVPSIDPLPCSQTIGNGTIRISISATNRLGNGPATYTNIGTLINLHVCILI